MLRAEQKVLVEYEKGTEKIKNILKSKIGKKKHYNSRLQEIQRKQSKVS